MKTSTPITDQHAFHRITGIASPEGDVIGVKVARSLECVTRQMLDSFAALGNDVFARIDARALHAHYTNKIKKLGIKT